MNRGMREKNLLNLLLGLNVALAACFALYVSHSSHRPDTGTTTGRFASSSRAPADEDLRAVPTTKIESGLTGPPPRQALRIGTSSSDSEAEAHEATSHASIVLQPTRIFTASDVMDPSYGAYLSRLRRVGCPEQRVQAIVLEDIETFIGEERRRIAVQFDFEWWHVDPPRVVLDVLRDKAREIERRRRELVSRWINAAAAERLSSPQFWTHVPLTGPELGGLSPAVHERVQAICAEAMERTSLGTFEAQSDGEQVQNPVAMAQQREHTRQALRACLNDAQLEAFLVRYSHNAHCLRQELRSLAVTPDEFRAIFRQIDPLDHAVQLQYGRVEAMSPAQRERHQRQRETILRRVLGKTRFARYLRARDPLYEQAQRLAKLYGAPNAAVEAIYQLAKTNEQRRLQIIYDSKLTSAQRAQALEAIFKEQAGCLRQLLARE